MSKISIKARSKNGSPHLLLSGNLYDAAGRELGHLYLKPGLLRGRKRVSERARAHHRELAPGTYYYRFKIERHSGEFSVEVHMLQGTQWIALSVDPPSIVPVTVTGYVAAFKVP